MTGYELRLWRKGMNWSSDKAAEELGVSLRTYKDYEHTAEVKRAIELATIALSVDTLIPVFERRNTSKTQIVGLLRTTFRPAQRKGKH